MSAQERRERRFLKRERELVQIAEQVIAQHGCHAFSIDKLASRFEYSRSTIYLHFDNKADVLCAVAAAVLDRQIRACELVFDESATSRERLLTLALVHRASVRLYPHIIMISMHLYDPKIIDDANERRRAALEAQRARGYAVAEGLVDQAKRDGHLPPDADSVRTLLPVWSIVLGGSAVLADDGGVWNKHLDTPDQVAFVGLNALLDGLGWNPKSDACDYVKVGEDIQRRISARIQAQFWNPSSPDPDI